MATENIISQIIQKTKTGFDISRTNYETHSEFVVKFPFNTGDTLIITTTPVENLSKVEIQLDTGTEDTPVFDTILPHIDPISFYNQSIIIPHYDEPDEPNFLNGITMLYSSPEVELSSQPDRMLIINEVDTDAGHYLYCEFYKEVYNTKNHKLFRKPLEKTISIDIYDHIVVSRCTSCATKA